MAYEKKTNNGKRNFKTILGIIPFADGLDKLVPIIVKVLPEEV